ncbi:Predicted dithiol-disulfide isomerase, DsbA family [Halovenus aranensis]|uniref:Predicted dithiol-disulfide isomerase, DsbA family n=1 Tax=Halovenus aranensis TaxID=890420 RepID=A0A1G8XL84_9EURY|nr:DsbA family protein [Halovenus aranensis]SDJ90665.1 Predicted dithiol-disulfide isomerase, DsbA family [Halovenus aranensis]
MSHQATAELTVYADYVCPFCYLGYVSLDSYRTERDGPLAVHWQPFDLRASQRRPDGTIDHDVDTGKDEEYYEEARKNVERLADQYGVDMVQNLSKDIDSYDAQRVGLRASEQYPDRFDTFHRGVFDALWEDGRDIGEQSVLASVAEQADLPDGFVAETLADDASADQLDEAFAAAQSRRITGVPTFVFGEHAARGAVPPEHLRRLVEGA